MSTARKIPAGTMDELSERTIRRVAYSPDDVAAIKTARASAIARLAESLDNFRRLVKVRRVLARAGAAASASAEIAAIDRDAMELLRDIDQTLIRIERMDAATGVKFPGDALQLRKRRTEIWDEYRAAMEAAPARLRRKRGASSKDYMRRYRERRRRGVRHVVPVEITDTLLQTMVANGMLTAEEAADRKSVAELVDEIVSEFIETALPDMREWRRGAPSVDARNERFARKRAGKVA